MRGVPQSGISSPIPRRENPYDSNDGLRFRVEPDRLLVVLAGAGRHKRLAPALDFYRTPAMGRARGFARCPFSNIIAVRWARLLRLFWEISVISLRRIASANWS